MALTALVAAAFACCVSKEDALEITNNFCETIHQGPFRDGNISRIQCMLLRQFRYSACQAVRVRAETEFEA
jgi:hypothetical protein